MTRAPLTRVELLGFIAVWEDGADGHFEYVAQVKTAFKPLTTGSWGVGFVMGTGRDAAFSGAQGWTLGLTLITPPFL